MDKSIVEILSKIEENGFEAYIVGGYVRDYLLGKDTKDIDICTNARVKDLVDIYSNYNIVSNNYGAVKFTYNDFKFDITTYREDVKYKGNRRNLEVRYIDNLMEDIKRRDFTCNSLCMSKEGNIIDIMDGEKDIKDKLIRCIGDIDQKLSEDPLRILRAIRFATTLDFKIEEELFNKIKEHKSDLDNLSTGRIKEELTKILVCPNAKIGLSYIKRLKLNTYLGIEYDKIVYVSDICGMFSQMEFKRDYPFTTEEKEHINSIREILNNGKIDRYTVYKYGLYLSLVAGDILGINKKDIIKIDKDLVINSKKDINIKGTEIASILGIKPSKIIGIVFDELADMLINNRLNNEYEDLKNYIYINRKKWVNGEKGAKKE